LRAYQPEATMKKIILVPLALFVVLLAFLAVGLKRDPHEIPSPLVNRPAPAFSLHTLQSGQSLFSPEAMRGKVWMLNVWATWCGACQEEHPVLVSFAREGLVPLVGLSYKEVQASDEPTGKPLSPEDKLAMARMRSQAWLRAKGDPYNLVAMDLDGRVGIDYGVYGVPETYVIDKNGVIRYKQIGAVTPALLEQKIRPLIEELNRS
jgi:cytochrome c biogenesis protein CcmG, thiol:disulfide interchange protein DsbE